MKVTFTEANFKELRKFQNAFNNMLGMESYVGTEHACMVVYYSNELKTMLHPYPTELNYEFELRVLTCEDCKKGQPYLCAKDEKTHVCWECASKRAKKKS